VLLQRESGKRLPRLEQIMNRNLDSTSGTVVNGWPPKLLLTFDEASNALSISRGMLRKLARAGCIKVTRIGRCTRVPQDEVLRLCDGGQILGGGK
jgi:excisionase family DNA binding protein